MTQYHKENPIKKWAKNLNKHFSKKDIQIQLYSPETYEKCSTSPAIREIEIKTTMRDHQ